jgi:hypothetical protein
MGERQTIADVSHEREHAIGPSAAWFGERWLARVIASRMEEILDLRRGKPESSESIVALWWMIENGKKVQKNRKPYDSVEIEAPKLST